MYVAIIFLSHFIPQAVAELELTWYQDVEDIAGGSLEVTGASFYGALQQEVSGTGSGATGSHYSG